MTAPTIIWEFDGEPIPGRTYGIRLAEELRAAGLQASIVPLYKRSLTQAELGAPTHLLSGGSSVMDPHVAWMRNAIAQGNQLVKAVHDGQAFAIGVCQGSQHLAAAVAGQVVSRSSLKGIEVGLSRVEFVEPKQDPVVVGQFHYHDIDRTFLEIDQVHHLMKNSHSTVQGYQWRNHLLGYQFHPEFSPDDLRALVRSWKSMISEYGSTAEVAMASIDRYESDWRGETFERLVCQPLQRFLEQIP